MLQVIVGLFGISALVLISVWANGQFGDHECLPIQWGFDGSVTGRGSRTFVLAFTPILGTIVLVAAIVATIFQGSTTSQDAYVLPVVTAIAVTFVALHSFHVWLIRKTLRKGS